MKREERYKLTKEKNESGMVFEKITVTDMIRWGVSRMRKANVHYFYFGTPDLFLTASYLTFFVLNLPYDYKNLVYLNSRLEKHEILAIKKIINKRITTRLPTPYITNERWYGVPGTTFYVNQDVFIPMSPIQYKLQDFMKDVTWNNNKVLDLGAGSGAVGIILALLNPNIQVDLVDICPKALKVAQINIDKYNLGKRVKCIQSDLFKNIKNKYDFIVTVPPQISMEEYKTIPAEALHEPTISLISEEDGLKHIKSIIEEAPKYLNSKGMLAAEIGNRLPNLIKAKYAHLKFKWFKFQKEDWIFSWKK